MPSEVISTGAKLPERYRIRGEEIRTRVDAITGLLAPCKVDAIRDAVIRLRSQFRPQPDTDAEALATGYVGACRDLPEWSLSEAANDFLAGRVDGHTGQFMPTCAEFAKRARWIITPFMAELSSLRVEASKLFERAADDQRRHVIEMERQSPAVRRRVADLASAFSAGSTKSQGAAHQGLSNERQARIDAFKKPRQFVSKIGHEQQKREG
jgi:hypothetical protein